MSPPTILRPIRPDERSWLVRYSNWISLIVIAGAALAALASDPKMFQKALAGDTHEIRFLLSVGIYPVVMLFAAFALPKALAKQQRSVLTITDDDVTLKLRSAGVNPEQVVWTVKRNDLREIRPFGSGNKAQFIFLMKTDSAIKRFFQVSDSASGRRLKAGSWVLNTRMDVKENPPMRSSQVFITSSQVREAMLKSDLGKALAEHGYLKPDANGKWVMP